MEAHGLRLELSTKVGELEADGFSAEVIEPLRQQLTALKLAALEAELEALKGELGSDGGA